MYMNIIRKNITPDGISIQFEQHGNDYVIGAYPIAKHTGRNEWIRSGDSFRLSLASFNTLEEAAGIYDGIKDGYLKLTDDVIVEHYWNGKKDRFYMGLEDSED